MPMKIVPIKPAIRNSISGSAKATAVRKFRIAGFIGTIFISMVLPIFTLQDYIK